MRLKLALVQDQITGFSYSFSSLLLDRLNECFKKDNLYTKYEEGMPKELTTLAQNLTHYLKEQIPYVDWSGIELNVHNFNFQDWKEKKDDMLLNYNLKVQKVIDEAGEFLDTFMVEV